MTALNRTSRVGTVLSIAIGGAIALIVGAHAHLVYVAFASQPDCVPHVRIGETVGGGAYAAARSSCGGSRAVQNLRSGR